MSVLIETTLGDLVVDLFIKERPRVEENYIAQTGDPTGTGRGGESIFSQLYGDQAKYFEMEFNPKLRHLHRGALSMVNNGQDMHGSQFFVTLADELDYLDGKHTVFGQVTEGWETLDKINEAICDENHLPYQDIRIMHTVILDDPFEDPKMLSVPSRSPSPTLELINSARIGVDEVVDETEGETEEEIQREIDEKDTKARAHILEMVGDLHHADEKPPDNVLFVCKLNPVTTSEDLEIIFARFGKIVECEVIKDKKSGASLQYAFIEFETPEQCEAAYFKMDNVLIDDRRVHVDFSQSVAKNYQWQKQVGPHKTAKKEDKDRKSSKSDKHKRKRSRSRSKSKDRRRSPPRHKHHRHERDRRRSRSPRRRR